MRRVVSICRAPELDGVVNAGKNPAISPFGNVVVWMLKYAVPAAMPVVRVLNAVAVLLLFMAKKGLL
jgi:hypothetical protein